MENNGVNAAYFRLLLNGTDLSEDLVSAVEGITLEDEINLPAVLTVKFNMVDFERDTWRGGDLETFKPGDEVKVSMGIDRAVEMMTGEITSLDLSFGEPSILEVICYDRLHRLRFGTRRRSFKDMKDSDIAASIAREVKLTPDAEDTGTVVPYLFQNNQTNYAFLLERAGRIGYEIFADDKKLIFRRSQETKATELTLEYKADLDSFSGHLRTLTEGSKVEVRWWDMKNKEEVTSTASSGSETTVMGGQKSGYKISQDAFIESPVAVLDEAVIDVTDADNLARAGYNTRLREFITGEGKCTGNPAIRAGKTIEINGLSDRFNGVYYVVKTVHTMNDDGYTTNFTVKRTGI